MPDSSGVDQQPTRGQYAVHSAKEAFFLSQHSHELRLFLPSFSIILLSKSSSSVLVRHEVAAQLTTRVLLFSRPPPVLYARPISRQLFFVSAKYLDLLQPI